MTTTSNLSASSIKDETSSGSQTAESHQYSGNGASAKHTPGPWSVRNHVFICAPDGERLAEAKGFFVDPRKQANARLISAAPDMLEALQKILQDTDTDLSEAAMASIYAAIRKATQS